MGFEWAQTFEDGETRAACSKCGVPYRYPSELVRQNDGFFYCKRRCLEQTVLTRDRIQAQSRKRREAPPPKFVQPPNYAEDYLDAEAFAFHAVAQSVPTSTDPTELGWAVNYLADIVLQGRRPTLWDVRARALIKTCCDRLLTLQYGAPAGPSPSLVAGQVRYGGFASGSYLYTSIAIVAGVGLAKGYQVIGDAQYLNAASRCAHFLRSMQCEDIDNNGQTTTWQGQPYHIGGFAEGVTASGTITWVNRYNIFDVAGLWFLALLRTFQGGNTQYGVVSPADFSASTVATLDTMISEVTDFAQNGAWDVVSPTTRLPGLSVARPRTVYAPQGPATIQTGTWALTPAPSGSPVQVLPGRDYALALFALNYARAATDLVDSVYDWLMSFSANPANAAPTEDASMLIGNTKGTYSPLVAIADYLDVLGDDGNALAQEHVGAKYDWMATALLSPIASARRPTDFAASKNTLSLLQPSSSGPNPLYRSINERGESGLSLQIIP